MFECLDLLQDVVFEDLEVRGLQTFDDSPVARRVHVHADEARANADGLLILGGNTDDGARREQGDSDGAHG